MPQSISLCMQYGANMAYDRDHDMIKVHSLCTVAAESLTLSSVTMFL